MLFGWDLTEELTVPCHQQQVLASVYGAALSLCVCVCVCACACVCVCVCMSVCVCVCLCLCVHACLDVSMLKGADSRVQLVIFFFQHGTMAKSV